MQMVNTKDILVYSPAYLAKVMYEICRQAQNSEEDKKNGNKVHEGLVASASQVYVCSLSSLPSSWDMQ